MFLNVPAQGNLPRAGSDAGDAGQFLGRENDARQAGHVDIFLPVLPGVSGGCRTKISEKAFC